MQSLMMEGAGPGLHALSLQKGIMEVTPSHENAQFLTALLRTSKNIIWISQLSNITLLAET